MMRRQVDPRFAWRYRIRELPLENLQHIFEFAIDPNDAFSFTRRSITHVCQYWRAAAFGTQGLWSTITLAPDRVRGRQQMLSADFERATSPYLYITIPPWNIEEDHSDWVLFIDLIIPQLRRLRALEAGILVPCSSNKLAMGICETGLPMLTSYTSSGMFIREKDIDIDDSASVRTGYVFIHAPALKIVTLRYHTDCSNIHLLPLTIQDLNLHFCNIPKAVPFLDILASLPSLVRLKLHHSLPYTDIHSCSETSHSIILPELRSLILAVRDDIHDAWFVRQLVCPRLRQLSLASGRDGDFEPVCLHCYNNNQSYFSGTAFHELPRAIAEQCWPLDTLDICGLECTIESLICLIKSTRSIRYLTVQSTFEALSIAEEATEEEEETGEMDSGTAHISSCRNLEELAIRKLDEPIVFKEALDSSPSHLFSRLRMLYAPPYLPQSDPGIILGSHPYKHEPNDRDKAWQYLRFITGVSYKWPDWAEF